MKKVVKIFAIVLAIIALAVVGYLVYVLVSYERLDDMKLPVQNIAMGHKADEDIYGEVDKAVPVGKELMVTSYNIGFGAYSDDFTFFMDGGTESWAFSEDAVYQNIGGAMKTLRDQKPDIALLQEVDFDATRSYHIDENAFVAELLAADASYDYVKAQNYNSAFLMYPLYQPHGANKSSIMTFAKYEIESSERIGLPIEKGLSKFLDLDRCFSKSKIKTEKGNYLVVYDFHLSAYTTDPETAQIQLKMVVEDMTNEYEKGNYCIAGGDFNCDVLGNSPEIFHTESVTYDWAQPIKHELFSYVTDLVAPYSEETNAATCRNPNKPYEVGDYVVSVDGFIITKNVELIKSDVIDTGFKYSDHNPVYMRIILKEE